MQIADRVELRCLFIFLEWPFGDILISFTKIYDTVHEPDELILKVCFFRVESLMFVSIMY